MKYIKKITLTIIVLSTLLSANLFAAFGLKSKKENNNPPPSIESLDMQGIEISKRYQEIAVSLLYARAFFFEATKNNDEAVLLKAKASNLSRLHGISIAEISEIMKTHDLWTLKFPQEKLADSAKNAYITSFAHFAVASAKEAVLVKDLLVVAKDAKAVISASKLKEKVSTTAKLTPLIKLAASLPKNGALATKTIAEYIAYGIKNGMTKEELTRAKEEILTIY